MKDVCVYCRKVVEKDSDDRMVLKDSGIVVHGTCRKLAIEEIKNSV